VRACSLHKTKRLRQLFGQMDKQKTGTLTLEQFREYMARENPRSIKRAAEIFAAMVCRHHDTNPEEGCKQPTVSFQEVRCTAGTRGIGSQTQGLRAHDPCTITISVMPGRAAHPSCMHARRHATSIICLWHGRSEWEA
jgi:hypothetical protein